MFQSLLWWIGRVNAAGGRWASRQRSGFNPCCGGLVASTRISEVPDSAFERFNPCCGGLVASTTRLHLHRLRRRSSFNPCCGGLVASTWLGPRAHCVDGDTAFQSLLWWIGRVNTLRFSTLLAIRMLFQSLLWWIGRVNTGMLCRRGLEGWVSILVVVDWSRQLVAIAAAPMVPLLFQSLLWWIGRVNGQSFMAHQLRSRVSILVVVDWSRQRPGAAGQLPGIRGFNPCCGGLVASTPDSRSGRLSLPPFQSLLWWIGRVNRSLEGRDECRDTFQSLLWWIGRVNTMVVTGGSPSVARFQSLLWWIGRVNSSSVPPARSPARCFNPCCGGLVASTQECDALSR